MKLSIKDKASFYIRGIKHKFWLPIECSKGRIPLITAEIIWIINDIFKTKFKQPNIFASNYFETKFGKFYTEKELTNIIIISPSFERHDKEKLIDLIEKSLKRKEKVLFIDIGAHVGVYAISIGNRFKRYGNLNILAFEPDSDMFSMNSFKLLKKNIKLNNVRKIKLYNIGLGSKSEVNKIGVRTKPLDSILSKNVIGRYDAVFIKIDIEGYEIDALEGARKVIDNAKKITLMIEDCINPEIEAYLKGDFKFHSKITPYNSFWTKE